VQQLIDTWGGLDIRRRATLVGGIAGVLTVLVLLSRLAMAPSYALLYSGLDPAAAGEVISALETRGVRYQVRGDSIHVEEINRDALRMSLAGEGLPALGAQGYELLDSLSGFGTTSQMFDAAYWRAREGELARTIAASPRIRAARVLLATSGNNPFQPQIEPSASVSIRPVSGGISASHGQALRYLVAAAVPGLLPENVTIIDSDSGRVLAGEDLPNGTSDASGQAEQHRRNIERLLNARVGPGNAVVEVSVELVRSRETVLERRIDPDSRVVIGTESEEMTSSSSESGNGAVTVASNLPEGDAAGGGGGNSTLQNTESRESVTYDISEIQREVENGPGAIRRISVAVLVNAVPVAGPDGILQPQPRGAAELESLQTLVQSAIGFDPARGDIVTIQSMAFEPRPDRALVEVAGAGIFARLDVMTLLQLLGLVVVALAVAFGVVRPLLMQRATSEAASPNRMALPMRAPALGLAGPQSATPAPAIAPPPATADAPMQPQAAAGVLPETGGAVPTLTSETSPDPVQVPALMVDETADPVARLRRLIEEREEETVEILRSWMAEDEEAT
jgi:flagellar M-ring protein FliF